MSAPVRRTLARLATPFVAYAVEGSRGRFFAQGDPKGPLGRRLVVVRTEVRAGCRYGYTEDGREVDFIGTARKVWVIPGDGQ